MDNASIFADLHLALHFELWSPFFIVFPYHILSALFFWTES